MDIDLTAKSRKSVVFGSTKKESQKQEQESLKEYSELLSNINDNMEETAELVREEEILKVDAGEIDILDPYEGLDKEDYERTYKSGEVAEIRDSRGD